MEELLITNLVLPIIKDIVSPKIKSVFNKFSIHNIELKKIEDSFDDYLSQRYEKYLIIDTIVFPNKQTLLKVLYQPMTLQCHDSKNKVIEIQINGFPKEFIPEYCRVIIEDTAGMGKSTILKKLFLSIIEQNEGIPVFIELSQINNKNSILREIQNQLSPIGKKISQDLILKIINEGGFIFLFDGFDEISLNNRDYVLNSLHSFIEKANQNYFLIASRPEESLSSFGDFQRFGVKSMNKSQAYSLINKYDNYSFHPISKSLIKKINDRHQDSLQEYLSNPFLVSLLYKSYEYKKDVPLKKSQFYQQVFDALYETHDLSKEGYLKREKYSNLHIDDFERVLRYVGYFTSIENTIEYDKNGIIRFINIAKAHLNGLKFSATDFLKDLLKTVPIFKKEGNYYKWGHKSLQDYFAAKFLWIDSKEKQVEILKKIFQDKRNFRFFNVLDIFYELDPVTFEKTILYWLLIDFIEYKDKAYIEIANISDNQILKRISSTYNKEIVFFLDNDTPYRDSNYIDNIKLKHNLGKYNNWITFEESGGETFNILYYFKKENIKMIMGLIKIKIPKIVVDIILLRPKELINQLQDKELYHLDDSKTNHLNSHKLFNNVTSQCSFRLLISPVEALKKYSELNKVIESKKSDDFTNW